MAGSNPSRPKRKHPNTHKKRGGIFPWRFSQSASVKADMRSARSRTNRIIGGQRKRTSFFFRRAKRIRVQTPHYIHLHNLYGPEKGKNGSLPLAGLGRDQYSSHTYTHRPLRSFGLANVKGEQTSGKLTSLKYPGRWSLASRSNVVCGM